MQSAESVKMVTNRKKKARAWLYRSLKIGSKLNYLNIDELLLS